MRANAAITGTSHEEVSGAFKEALASHDFGLAHSQSAQTKVDANGLEVQCWEALNLCRGVLLCVVWQSASESLAHFLAMHPWMSWGISPDWIA